MATAVDDLLVDFVEWLAAGPRAYTEVMEAWRTSCPRLTVWEDAVDRGLVARRAGLSGRPEVEITAEGRAFLSDR